VKTEVFVPRIHYRGAYDVEARGMKVVSKPGRRALKLRWRRHADDASITVTPKG
jgi:hypothetical protein